MHKEWIGCAPENFAKGRPSGLGVQAVVIHSVEGPLQEVSDQFHDPTASLSTHYIVGKDGRILQCVEENDTAFHAGVIVSPTWKLIRGGSNPNFYTIGVAYEGRPADELPEVQVSALAALVADICARRAIPPDADHLVLHSEIRASKNCPGSKFDRMAFLQRLKASPESASASLVSLSNQVNVLSTANVRESAPSTQARIARVIEPNTSVIVTGFTQTGERVRGNASWYRTADGDYLWAGVTSEPNPRKAVLDASPVPPPPQQPTSTAASRVETVAMATKGQCGILQIDSLCAGTPDALPLAATESDRDAIAAVQDLLLCHGFRSIPGLMSAQRGSFGQKTVDAIRTFQGKCNLPVSGNVDAGTLNKLITEPASDPRASQPYLTLVLGLPFTGMMRVLSLVAQMEGVGRFAALNLNTDRAGLSFGLIQWAQRPGRLPELLKGFRNADSGLYNRIFGAGQASLGDELIAHVSRTNGGVDPKTGVTVSPAFNLIVEPWLTRFRAAGAEPAFQTAQVDIALAVFRKSQAFIQKYAPELKSERALAFMLDVANQFGDGGARNLYNTVKRPGMAEPDLLEDIGEESVKRMPQEFKAGVRGRREGFLHTKLLSDDPFVDS